MVWVMGFWLTSVVLGFGVEGLTSLEFSLACACVVAAAPAPREPPPCQRNPLLTPPGTLRRRSLGEERWCRVGCDRSLKVWAVVTQC